MLPGLDGHRVCRAVRAAGLWTPILMLTAKDSEYDEAEGLDTGADDYLTKPFSYLILQARLRALLRRVAAARPALVEVGDLVLEPWPSRGTSPPRTGARCRPDRVPAAVSRCVFRPIPECDPFHMTRSTP